MTKSSSFIDIVVGYNSELNTSTSNTKFCGIVMENSLSWKVHRDQLIPKLYTAYYTIRAIKPFMSQDRIKVGMLFLCHCLMIYGILFWGNSSHSIHSDYKKRIIRIFTKSGPRDSCRELFKKLKVLPFQLQFVFSVLLFVVNTEDQY